jgi:DNA repair exonuclease SbcCD nuclease subunit
VLILIGDVHAGRTFKTGVPLERIGNREVSIFDSLAQALKPSLGKDIRHHFVIMGDLFDKFAVSNETLQVVYNILYSASYHAESITILRGNHDCTRDKVLVSSFQILKALCSRAPNITFVDGDTPLISTIDDINHCLFGYHPFVSAKAMAEALPPLSGISIAYGHWDITAHGEDTHNLIPIETLKEKGITSVYIGHIHKYQRLQMSGINVTVVGSMQPYAHGEEAADDHLYRTFYADEAKGMLEENPAVFHMTNLRVLLQADDVWDVDRVDCLSLVFKRIEGDRAVEDITVGYDDFSSETIFNKNLTEVSEGLRQHITARIEHYRNLEN